MAISAKPPIGLVIPTRYEAQDVLERFTFNTGETGLLETIVEGRIVYLCLSGVGATAATDAAHQLVAAGAKELVSMGFCGALVPELKIGDLVTDRIVSVEKPAKTPKERAALTGRANAIAVDMETRAVVEAGTRMGVPIHMLRVVSDAYGDDLTALFGSEGGFSKVGIAVRLLNPLAWPVAKKLRTQSLVARAKLADYLERFLQAR